MSIKCSSAWFGSDKSRKIPGMLIVNYSFDFDTNNNFETYTTVYNHVQANIRNHKKLSLKVSSSYSLINNVTNVTREWSGSFYTSGLQPTGQSSVLGGLSDFVKFDTLAHFITHVRDATTEENIQKRMVDEFNQLNSAWAFKKCNKITIVFNIWTLRDNVKASLIPVGRYQMHQQLNVNQ